MQADHKYIGIPFAKGGRYPRTGLDCRGLAYWFAESEFGLVLPDPVDSPELRGAATELAEQLAKPVPEAELRRGDLVLFRMRRGGPVSHVATYLGDGKYLHTVAGYASRVETMVLMRRIGLDVAAVVRRDDCGTFARALADTNLGVVVPIWLVVGMMAVSIGLAVASIMMMPKAPNMRNLAGRYGMGFENLYTRTTAQEPLANILGNVAMAGICVYQTGVDKNLTVDAIGAQSVNNIVVLSSGPVKEDKLQIRVASLDREDKYFFNGTANGIAANPAQTKAEAFSGTIAPDTWRPSVSGYFGDHGISVPVDIRAHYDRGFPVYGFSGCAYVVWRLINPTKFQNFTMLMRVRGRRVRQYDSNGFDVNTITDEALTGADGTKVRFKLSKDDIKEVDALTVNGVAQTKLSETNQGPANVYHLNKLKGYIEFLTAPAAGATILITYKNYPRDYSQNPADHLVYLLTEGCHGKGFDESRIDWPAAVALRDYCDQKILWRVPGISDQAKKRFKCNYVLDYRKPMQEHLRAVLDSCLAGLFISNGKIVMRARTAGESVYDFDQSSILADSFSSVLIDRTDRPNQIKAIYHSEDSLFAETEIAVDDEHDQQARAKRVGNDGIVDETIYLPAVTSEPQAQRIAESILREGIRAKWRVEFTTSIKGLALEPYDLIRVTHSSQPTWSGKKFRIESIEHDDQDRLKITAIDYYGPAYI